MSLSALIQESKLKLPLPEMLRAIGDGHCAKSAAPSPFRDGDNKGCFGIFQKQNGEWNWKDQVTGEFGDEIDYIILRQNLSKEDATARFLELAGVTAPASKFCAAMNGVVTRTVSGVDWPGCVAAFSDHSAEVAEWRGYQPAFLERFRSTAGIGWYEDKVAFPVHFEGHVIGCHYRQDDGTWFYSKGCRVSPVVIGNPAKAKEIILCESQWDALALADRMDWHTWENDTEIAIVATRGAGNHALVKEFARPGARYVAFVQNDKPDLKTGKVPAEEWMRGVTAALSPLPVHRASYPVQHKDANDWTRAGATGADIFEAIEGSRVARQSSLSVRSVGELIGMDFDDADNYFGDRIIAAGQNFTLLGPGGIGKSRIMLQMAICMITGKDFLDMPTHGTGKHWLFIQSENSNRRLHADLKHMMIQLRLTSAEWEQVNACLHIHTIENDEDAYLDLSNPDNAREVSGLIADYPSDFVVFDPLNTFTVGDLNSDQDMRAVVTEISKLVKKGNPNRVPMVVHHSLTGKTGAAKVVGWDKSSYGRNSKVLFNWTRAQVNFAPSDPDNNDVMVMSCGKASNGRPFPEVGVLFDGDAGIYRINPDFDGEAFRDSVGIEKAKPKGIAIAAQDVADLFEDTCDRKTLVTRIMSASGCQKTRAYVAIEEAEKAKVIIRGRFHKWNPDYTKPNPQTEFSENEK